MSPIDNSVPARGLLAAKKEFFCFSGWYIWIRERMFVTSEHCYNGNTVYAWRKEMND